MPDSLPKSRTSRKRAMIVEAASEAFFAHGYESVSMESIAAMAGVSKQTLYNHFTGKESLFCEVVRAECENFLDSLTAIDIFRSPREVLASVGRAMLESIVLPKSVALFRVLVAQTARQAGLAQEFYEIGPRKAVQWLADYMKAETAAGRLAITDSELAAEEFLGMVTMESHFRTLFGSVSRNNRDPREIEKRLISSVDTFLKAYGRPEGFR